VGENVTERFRRGLAVLLAAVLLSPIVAEPRAEPAERVTAAAPIAGVVLEFADRSLLALGARTKVRLDDYEVESASGSLKGLLSLLGGILRMNIVQSTKTEDFSIRTKTAIASARSTDWIVEAQPSETAVFVLSGVVTVAGAAQGASVRVSAGQGTSVAASSSASPAAPKIWGRSGRRTPCRGLG